MSQQRSKNRFVGVGVFVNAVLLLGPLLVISPAVVPVDASRVVDGGYLGVPYVTDLMVPLPLGAAWKNTTLEMPLNSTARHVATSVNLTGIPALPFSNLTGDGTANRDNEQFGEGLEGTGDYNDDGFLDMAVGANCPSCPAAQGRVVVYWGTAAGYGSRPNWSFLGPASTGFGHSLTHGDYNHDAVDDLVVGTSNPQQQLTERVMIFFGSASGLPSVPSLYLNYTSVGRFFGWGSSLAGGLDLNNDTYDELIVGLPFYNLIAQKLGRVMVLWGGPGGLNFSANTTLDGPSVDAIFGFSLRQLGDTDADNVDEFAVGAYGAWANDGEVVVYEGEDATTNIIQRWNASGTSAEFFGYTLAGGSNLSGTSDADLVVGAPNRGTLVGAAHIFEGTGSATYNPGARWTMNAATAQQEQFAVSLDIVGDLTNDGTNDLIIGANRYNNFDGRLYLFLDANFTTSQARIFEANHTNDGENVGWRVAALGDVNQDGFADFATSLVTGYNGSTAPGSVRPYYGRASFFPVDVRLFVDTTEVFFIPGPLTGTVFAQGFPAAFQSYVDSHQGSANATGIILSPFSFNFSGGGILSVSEIQVRYSYVSPPPNVRVTAPPAGRSLLIAWDLHATDATVFSVWSNKTGSTALVGTASFPRTSFLDTNLTDGQTYYYWVTETDASAALESGPSVVAWGVPLDSLAPATPRNFSLTPFNANHSAWLVWSPNDDDIASYEILRQALGEPGFTVVDTVAHPQNSYLDAGLAEEITYNYSVRAVDPAGLMSAPTAAQTIALPDTIAPPAVQNVRAVTQPSGIAVNVSWDANVDDTVAYAVFLSLSNGTSGMVDMGHTAATAFSISNLQRDTTYWVAVKAIDKVSHLSPFSNMFEVTTVDTLAPSPPVITGFAVPSEGNRIRLNWTAGEDDIAAFRVYANTQGSWSQIATFPGAARTGIIDNLTDGTLYALRIAALDLGDRLSGDSNSISATPRDTLRPSAPTGISVVALPTGSALTISWIASQDSDLVNYKLFALDSTASGSFVLIATLAAGTNHYNHTALKNGVTYSYEIYAVDEVPNESPPSARSVGVPRDIVPPAAPRLDALPARTNHVTLQISGTSEEGLEVQVFLNGAQRQKVTAGVAGRFTVTLSLAQGDNAISVRAVDTDPSVEPGYRTGPESATTHIILDTALPAIASATPPDGSSGIPVGQRLTITFSEEVDPASVVVTLKDSSGAAVAGNVTIAVDRLSLTFAPTTALKNGEHYALTVNATDAAGNEMPQQTVSFSTVPPEGQTGGLPGPSAAAAALALAGAAIVLALARRRRQ